MYEGVHTARRQRQRPMPLGTVRYPILGLGLGLGSVSVNTPLQCFFFCFVFYCFFCNVRNFFTPINVTPLLAAAEKCLVNSVQ